MESTDKIFIAGCFIFVQPPPSVPNAAAHIPEATIAAGPDEDPPVYLSGACGFLVVLHKKGLQSIFINFQLNRL